MRCMFVVDEIARFREVAVVLDSCDSVPIMVKEFALPSELRMQAASTLRS